MFALGRLAADGAKGHGRLLLAVKGDGMNKVAIYSQQTNATLAVHSCI